MRTNIILVAISSALIVSESQCATIYNNLDNDGGTNSSFGGGPGFPSSRILVGEDVSTLAPANAGDTWQVDSISFFTLAFGNMMNSVTFTNVTVEVIFYEGVTGIGVNGALGDSLATSFGNATELGRETFELGSFSTGATGGNLSRLNVVNFTEAINIGDGQNIGITFGFNDDTVVVDDGLVARTGGLALAYRGGGSSPAPAIGSTSDRNFRDGDLDGEISSTSDDFGFTGDIGGRFSIEATAVPEPTSITLLGLVGLGLVVRRRR